MNPLFRRLKYWLPALSYAVVIFWASSAPLNSRMLKSAPDYLLHSAAYFVLYVLVFIAVHESCAMKKRWAGYWLPLVLTVLYGISDEYHQSFVPLRDASILDVAADAVGAMLGALLFSPASRMISRFFASPAR